MFPLDILDATTSDIQMDADSSSLQNAPSDIMAPPAFPPTPEIPSGSSPAVETAAPTPPSLSAPRTILPPSYTGPPRLERQTPVSRQHLTPFTIPVSWFSKHLLLRFLFLKICNFVMLVLNYRLHIFYWLKKKTNMKTSVVLLIFF